MNLFRVTVTGADDSVRPVDLAALQAKHPFVEWGILVSSNREGEPRYPTMEWLSVLRDMFDGGTLQLSAHLCGDVARRAARGDWSVWNGRPWLGEMFGRVQLNVRANVVDPDALAASDWGKARTLIIPNGYHLFRLKCHGLDAVPIYDQSGGRGILPNEWPFASLTVPTGYAGGLTPENVAGQLDLIRVAAGGHDVWIDVETGVRTDDQFDLEKVDAFLEAARPWTEPW